MMISSRLSYAAQFLRGRFLSRYSRMRAWKPVTMTEMKVTCSLLAALVLFHKNV